MCVCDVYSSIKVTHIRSTSFQRIKKSTLCENAQNANLGKYFTHINNTRSPINMNYVETQGTHCSRDVFHPDTIKPSVTVSDDDK